MVKQTLIPATRMLLVMTILTGVIYPLIITLAAQTLFPQQANGSLIVVDEVVIGSALIGQSNSDTRYFWSRPSAVSYNPLPSGGSNLAMTSATLQETVATRADQIRQAHDLAADVPIPPDLLFASASGLDPHISPEAARLQIERVAAARDLPVEQVASLVDQFSEPAQLGVLGQPRLNVLLLNLALDEVE